MSTIDWQAHHMRARCDHPEYHDDHDDRCLGDSCFDFDSACQCRFAIFDQYSFPETPSGKHDILVLL